MYLYSPLPIPYLSIVYGAGTVCVSSLPLFQIVSLFFSFLTNAQAAYTYGSSAT